jgi:hypothetical protein
LKRIEGKEERNREKEKEEKKLGALRLRIALEV